MLTSKGIKEKGKLTVSFLKRKISEYHEIKKQIEQLHREVEREGLGSPGSDLKNAVKILFKPLSNITNSNYKYKACVVSCNQGSGAGNERISIIFFLMNETHEIIGVSIPLGTGGI